jgi:hypothetical protein
MNNRHNTTMNLSKIESGKEFKKELKVLSINKDTIQPFFEFAVLHTWEYGDASYANKLVCTVGMEDRDLKLTLFNAFKQCIPYFFDRNLLFTKVEKPRVSVLKSKYRHLLLKKWYELPNIYSPEYDNRKRGTKSIKIWVSTKTFKNDTVSTFSILDSIERTIYKIEGVTCVRYLNRYHKLHSENEFKKYKQLAIQNEIIFIMKKHGFAPKPLSINELKKVEDSKFIFNDEELKPSYRHGLAGAYTL